MNAIEKALWFIESHFASEITLEDLANGTAYDVCCNSDEAGNFN
jgi:hypothetical protein